MTLIAQRFYLRGCSYLLLCVLSLQVFAQTLNPFSYEITKYARHKNGMVVSAHPLASAAGVAMLQKGGNAVDAIIATQLALAVVYPVAGNLGGGAFFILRLADGTTKVLDYREVAPSLATKNMYLNKDGNVIEDLSVKGGLASGVPGTVAGLFASLQYAKLPFDTLIAPAIQLAQGGFALTRKEANMLNIYAKTFRKFNTTCALIKNKKWKKGDTLIQTHLAGTLERIRQNGRQEFYEGTTARLIVETMKRKKGIISLNDLKQYQVTEREPFIFNYRKDYTVIAMPPPSSGGFVLNQILKMAEQQPVSNFNLHSANSMHLVIEAERRAFADRAQYIGDPAFVKMPLQQLLDSHYLSQRIKKDFVSLQAGNSIKTTYGTPQESTETTHLSAVDKDRNVVVVTTTLNGNYGSFTIVDSAGFLLNNEMDDFSLKAGSSNMYGAVGEAQNFIAPHKKMLSSMSPTIVLKNNQFYFSVGSPGGTRIPTSVVQTMMNIIDFQQNTKAAVDTPRFHHQWLPDVVDIEEDFPKTAKRHLQKMGYRLVKKKSMGKVEVIKVTDDGNLEGVGDKRGDDAAIGY